MRLYKIMTWIKRNRITEEELFSYIKCPINYEITYIRKFTPKETVSMNVLLNKVFKVFCTHLMNGKIMSTNDLKIKWDRICESYPEYINPQRSLDGLGLLMKMWNWAAEVELQIIDMGLPYTIGSKFQDKVIELDGCIGIIAKDLMQNFYLLDMDFGNKYTEQAFLDMKLKYTIDCYAFKELYNKDLHVKIHNVKNNKDFFTDRHEDDFKRMKATIANVGGSVLNKMFYPRETSFCKSCNLLNFCKMWKC